MAFKTQVMALKQPPMIFDFESINAVIATPALRKILKHLWYLVQETVIYPLSSDNLEEIHQKALAQNFFPCYIQTLFIVHLLA